MSQRVMAALSQHSSALEVYSIDEAFIDFSGIPVEKLLLEIKYLKVTVEQWDWHSCINWCRINKKR